MIQPNIFQQKLLSWFSKNGRHHLPWKEPKHPYRIWISEIMLQQTQVKTVIPYFKQFIAQFPTVEALAKSPVDEVLHAWSGLGYYARARNLHKTARKLVEEYEGQLPNDLSALESLPGIGRSTAGAILSLGFNEIAPILDGNVKRILCRLGAVEGWPGKTEVLNHLWHLSEQYTPLKESASYTQAMMDFGSLVCVRSKPYCTTCPFHTSCLAYQKDATHLYPAPKPSRLLPTRTIRCLVLMNTEQEILLEKRPPVGIWGGLWSLPECAIDHDIGTWCQLHYGCYVQNIQPQNVIQHKFSHFTLNIHPVLCQVKTFTFQVRDNKHQHWVTLKNLHQKGLAAPIKKLLYSL